MVDRMLSPYRVLDLTDETGLLTGSLLGSLGADVIMVEPPGGGSARRLPPFVGGVEDGEHSAYWLAYGTNRRGVELDLTEEPGRRLFLELVRTADVVVESFAPGRLEALGLGFDALRAIRPELVLTSITPFGQSGPRAGWQGSDLVLQAVGGSLFGGGSSEGGRPPVRVSHVPQAYLQAGLDAAWATVMALFARGTTGRGQHVDVSTQASMERCGLHVQLSGQLRERPYESDGVDYSVLPMMPSAMPTIWQTADGYVSYGVNLAEQGARRNPRLIAWMAEEGQAEPWLVDYRWSDYVEWSQLPDGDVARIRAAYEGFFAGKTNAELMEAARSRDLMLIAEHTMSDVLAHPQLDARQYWHHEQHEALGTSITYPSRFVLASGSETTTTRRAPLLGEHTDQVLGSQLAEASRGEAR